MTELSVAEDRIVGRKTGGHVDDLTASEVGVILGLGTAAQADTGDFDAAGAAAAKVSDTAYDATSWDGVTTVAPSKNAVRDKVETLAPLASPALTGNPTAPTPSQGDNDTSIATTAYVQTEVGLLVPKSLVDAKGDLLVGTADNTVAKLPVGANGTRPIADSNQPTGLAYVGDSMTKAPFVSNVSGLFTPDTVLLGTAGAQTASTAQRAVWMPFWLPRRVATPKFYAQCSTLESGATIRFSTWSNNETTFRPATGGLIEDVGTVSGTTTGSKSITAANAIGPGWVWVGVWCSNHTTVRWFRSSGFTARHMGDNAFTNGRNVYGYLADSLDYSSAWSSTLPTLTVAESASHGNTPYINMEIT
jgi:hypothetical protein